MKKFILNMIVLAALLLGTAAGVQASENDAITLKVSLPDLNTSAEHVGIAVYQVAEPEIPGRTDKFVWIPLLDDIGIAPEELDTAARVRETAEKLAREVQEKEIPSRNAMTDQSGTVVFAGLQPGGYLITQTSGQETYGKIQNTLIFLPYTDENGMEIFHGEAAVKAEKPGRPEPSPTSAPRVTVTPVEKNPGSGNDPFYHDGSGDQAVYKKTARTGDSTQILPVLILLIAASAALAALGIIIYKRRKKLHKDK
nr:LPXTG cell wall anchor domain-containing protein [uncultured Blautia sp.]